MGRVRRRSRLTAPEALAAEMPLQLAVLELCGSVEDLRRELHRVRLWIDERVPGRGPELLMPVLEHAGFDMAGWYRRVLEE